MVVFEKVLNESADVLAVDEVVLVRGRVDHKEAGKTCVIVQSAEPFRPTPEEVDSAREQARALAAQAPPSALQLHLDATRLPATAIAELKHVLGNFPGESEVVLAIRTTAGARRLKLGGEFKVTPTASLRAELEHVLGPAALTA
jgi:DNA polymerase-3 subunit alpha